jgi:poly(3-hydroxybutyrate) depolymerase
MKAMSVLLLFVLAARLVPQDPPLVQSPMPTGFLTKTITVAGREHRYVVYVPPGYAKEGNKDKRWPLLVFLNGMGECGTDGHKQVGVGLGPAIEKDPDRWPFVVVFPQKPDKDSQWIEHDALVMGTLAATEKEYRVDALMRLLTGLSQGGAGAWALGAKHPDVFAAIAPVCGYGKPAEITPGLRASPLGIEIWAFHGLEDQVVPAQQSKDLCAAIEKAGGSARLTLYEGTTHNSWDKAYRESDLAEWLQLACESLLGRALLEPEGLESFRLSVGRSSISAAGRVDDGVRIAVGKRGDWRREGNGVERRLDAVQAAACLRECVVMLVRGGVIGDVRRPDARRVLDSPGDYVSLDYDYGIGGRSPSHWPACWKVGSDSAEVIEAIRRVGRRLEQLR